jgi:hypothetical protein
VFGEERVSKVKVHPNFDKFSEEVILDIMFGSVFVFLSSQEKLIFFPILKERNLKNPSIWIYNHHVQIQSILIQCSKNRPMIYNNNAISERLGLSRLCSATFEQLLAFGATFCGFSPLAQVLPFRAIFEQNIGLEHISSTKKSTISWKTSIHANFLKAYHVINLLNT